MEGGGEGVVRPMVYHVARDRFIQFTSAYQWTSPFSALEEKGLKMNLSMNLRK